MSRAFPDIRGAFRGRRVLVTGHTGFKGAWLCLWLHALGAKVTGIALPPERTDARQGIFEAANVEPLIDHRIGDIRSVDDFARALDGPDPEYVFHLAAQPLVRASYDDPVDTYLTNVVGTANVLNACRDMTQLKAVIVVTSDKCYENSEWVWGYRETDPMGGADPYSASKGCSELVAASFRRSYFSEAGSARIATVRAGNVIGGGDWSADRLVPDMMRSALTGETLSIRNPHAVRPWQHVLDPLGGYLGLAAGLALGGERTVDWASGWNFGPAVEATVDVRTIGDRVTRCWGEGGPTLDFAPVVAPDEASTLRLDSTKAEVTLGWRPRFDLASAIDRTVRWYRGQAEGADMRSLSLAQIADFEGEDHARLAA